MSDFDPTKNRIPFGLLTPEERIILKEWPHGWQIFDADSWEYRTAPTWLPDYVYRGKPAPEVETYFCNVYGKHCVIGWHDSYEDAVRLAREGHIGIICIEIVDKKLKDVRVVEGDET